MNMPSAMADGRISPVGPKSNRAAPGCAGCACGRHMPRRSALFDSQVEFADQHAPFGFFAVDVFGVFLGRRDQGIAALSLNTASYFGALNAPRVGSVATGGGRRGR